MTGTVDRNPLSETSFRSQKLIGNNVYKYQAVRPLLQKFREAAYVFDYGDHGW
jgi:hypothetical protein